ncbi:amidase family protein [Amycolatopsis sp. SID8362]|uniref:amidase family protein n=1 Tax=Amycolatopsis sp. SID8362 TaxID=2690346 RepID=UPI0035C8B77B
MVLAAVAYNLPDEGLPPATRTHRAWLARAEDRARARRSWARWFEDVDVLLCPVTAMPAFPHDHAGDIGTRVVEIDGVPRPHMSTIGWCGLFSVLGLPTVTMPSAAPRRVCRSACRWWRPTAPTPRQPCSPGTRRRSPAGTSSRGDRRSGNEPPDAASPTSRGAQRPRHPMPIERRPGPQPPPNEARMGRPHGHHRVPARPPTARGGPARS